ncbi:MAG: hypothetical protein AAF587_26555 [Bacteroidota bacterium]
MAVILIIAFRVFGSWISDQFSDTKDCPRCDGRGYWQNTRNRERCEWCNGSGRLPKNLEV